MRPLVFVDARRSGRAWLAASLARAAAWDATADDTSAVPEDVALCLEEIGLAPAPSAPSADGAERVDVDALVASDGAPVGALGGADDFERRVRARVVRDRTATAIARLRGEGDRS